MAGIIMPNFSFAQEEFGAAMPQTMGEAKTFINTILDKLPEAVMRVWKEEALPVWGKIWQEINPQIDIWRQKLFQLIGGEIEKNKPAIEEELQKQKKELEEAAKRELLKTGESFWGGLWEKFKTILELSPTPTPE